MNGVGIWNCNDCDRENCINVLKLYNDRNEVKSIDCWKSY